MLIKDYMEKEENWLKCLPFNVKKGKKLLIFFVIVNIFVVWFFYNKSTDVSLLMFHQTKAKTPKSVLIPIYNNVSIFHIPLLDAKDMTPFYEEVKAKTWCFAYGIDLVESKRRKKCVCSDNWFGLDCGIPSAVWKSSFMQEGKNANVEIKRRDRPRRIILSFVVNGQNEVLDINIYNTFSVVDLFLTVEGSNQNPSLLNTLKIGQLAEWQSKIIPFQVKANVTNLIDSEQTFLMLQGLWDMGWKKLADFRNDDLFIFSHVSSIISKDVLLFLKLYDGFSEPFFFDLRPLIFKFWRQMKSNSTDVRLVPFRPLGCTFQFLASMCNFEVSNLFANNCNAMNRKRYEKNNWPLKNWTIGSENFPSGWQCNFCCRDKCFDLQQTKANGSSLSISGREANESTVKLYLEKINAFNIKDLTFFKVPKDDPFFAPAAVLNNENKYSFLTDFIEYF